MSSGRQARVVAAAHSSGPISVSSEAGGNWPNTLTSTHGLSRPYFSICSRAHSRRDARRAFGIVGIGGDLGEVPQPPLAGAGAPQRALEMRRVAGLHDVALDARRSAASALAITASGMPPNSSRMNRM